VKWALGDWLVRVLLIIVGVGLTYEGLTHDKARHKRRRYFFPGVIGVLIGEMLRRLPWWVTKIMLIFLGFLSLGVALSYR
jgi:putative Mn2+ efflux pump MntP